MGWAVVPTRECWSRGGLHRLESQHPPDHEKTRSERGQILYGNCGLTSVGLQHPQICPKPVVGDRLSQAVLGSRLTPGSRAGSGLDGARMQQPLTHAKARTRADHINQGHGTH